VERKVYLDINLDKGVLHDLFLQKIARRDNREEGEIWNLDHLLTLSKKFREENYAAGAYDV
jgi:hypothetical protein